MAADLEDYALIGDCQTAVLVGRDGSIDWLCWPRFDSGACFAALVGTRDSGCWPLGAADPAARVSRRYRDSTLILETEIETADGAATVIDFMPPRGKNSDVVRLVRGKRGHLAMRIELSGSPIHKAEAGVRCAARTWWCCARGEDFTTVGEFTVAAGETVPFVLTYGPAYRALPGVIDAAEALRETETFWRAWANIAKPSGEWSEATERSLITLKALTHFPTGGIVAAPTTSLPERLGGKRNWDYRFCWLRDATFTLIALMNAGYYEDARAWREWLLRAVAGAPDRVQIMYAVTGEHRLPEWEVPWLCGYQGAPSRYAPAMPQPNTCKLTCSARSWTRSIMADLAISAPAPRAGNCNARCSIIWNMSGRRRTTAFGKCAAIASVSPIPRSWPGWRSTARSRASSSSRWKGRSSAGASCAEPFTTTSAGSASIPRSALLCRAMTRSISTPARCSFRWSDFCLPRIRA